MFHVLNTESIYSESAPQIKALVRNLSAFTTLFAPGKSWDKVRSTAVPYTESRLTCSDANERLGFPVVEQVYSVHRMYAVTSTLLSNFMRSHQLRTLNVRNWSKKSSGLTEGK